MVHREKLQTTGTKVYVQLGNDSTEFPYYFPRVPSIGEHIRILDSDGQQRHGVSETLCQVSEVHYSLLEGKHTGILATEDSIGMVAAVRIVVRPV